MSCLCLALPQTEAKDEVGEEGCEAGSDDTDDHPSCVVAEHVNVQGGPHEETVVEKEQNPEKQKGLVDGEILSSATEYLPEAQSPQDPDAPGQGNCCHGEEVRHCDHNPHHCGYVAEED